MSVIQREPPKPRVVRRPPVEAAKHAADATLKLVCSTRLMHWARVELSLSKADEVPAMAIWRVAAEDPKRRNAMLRNMPARVAALFDSDLPPALLTEARAGTKVLWPHWRGSVGRAGEDLEPVQLDSLLAVAQVLADSRALAASTEAKYLSLLHYFRGEDRRLDELEYLDWPGPDLREACEAMKRVLSALDRVEDQHRWAVELATLVRGVNEQLRPRRPSSALIGKDRPREGSMVLFEVKEILGEGLPEASERRLALLTGLIDREFSVMKRAPESEEPTDDAIVNNLKRQLSRAAKVASKRLPNEEEERKKRKDLIKQLRSTLASS